MSSSIPAPTTELRIFLYAMDSMGHLMPSIGMAQAFAARGHKVSLLLSEIFRKQFEKFTDFDKIFLTRTVDAETQNPVKQMAKWLMSSGHIGQHHASAVDKLKSEHDPASFMGILKAALEEYNPLIEKALEQEKPDLFILDHFLIPPALLKSDIPWIDLSSGNPLGLYKSDKLPPSGAGFPTASDPATWIEYKELVKAKMGTGKARYQTELNEKFGYTAPEDAPNGNKILSIYGYPEELDYLDVVPEGPKDSVHVDEFCRENPEPFELPEELTNRKEGQALIYLSLGSMGAVDLKLMRHILSALGKTSHRCIVSKGPLGDEYNLPENCWGANFLPQTRILPLVDLVITHGGNNTLTETFSAGKPLIVLPLFADQSDNGQRIEEKGYGARLDTYAFQEQELIDTVERLLADREMKARAKRAGERIRASKSKPAACVRIEQILAELKVNKKN